MRLPASLTVVKRVKRVSAILSTILTLAEIVAWLKRSMFLTFGPLLHIDHILWVMHPWVLMDLLWWGHCLTMMIDFSRNLFRTKCLSNEVLFGKLFIFP